MKKTYSLEKQTAICPTCLTEKPFTEFGKCSKRTIGINWYCKSCANLKGEKERLKPGYRKKRREIYKRYAERHRQRYLDSASSYARKKYAQLREEGKLQHILLFNNAKNRAKKFNLPFTLILDDIKIPEYCPVLGVKLEFGNGRQTPFSASIDRIEPQLGYTKENIIIVSVRANLIKNDSNIEELGRVYNFYKEILHDKSGKTTN